MQKQQAQFARNVKALPNTSSNPSPNKRAQLQKDLEALQAAGYDQPLNFLPDDLPNIEADLNNLDLSDVNTMAYFGVDESAASYDPLQLTRAHSAQSSTRWNHTENASNGALAAGANGQQRFGSYSAQQLNAHLPQLQASRSAQSPSKYQQQIGAQNAQNVKQAQQTFQSQQWALDKMKLFKQKQEEAAKKKAKGDAKGAGTTLLSVLSKEPEK